MGAKDEIKFVIASRRDYDFAREFTRSIGSPSAFIRCCFRPCSRTPQATGPAWTRANWREWILADGLPVRLGLQLHKFIWDPAMKGV